MGELWGCGAWKSDSKRMPGKPTASSFVLPGEHGREARAADQDIGLGHEGTGRFEDLVAGGGDVQHDGAGRDRKPRRNEKTRSPVAAST